MLGLLDDRVAIRFAAELGVLALLFVAGMRLRAFRDIYRKAIAVVTLQIGASVVLLVLVAPFFKWSITPLLAANTPGLAQLVGITAAVLLVGILGWRLSRKEKPHVGEAYLGSVLFTTMIS
jgi:Kef-type K+ transport system membrane component KefB